MKIGEIYFVVPAEHGKEFVLEVEVIAITTDGAMAEVKTVAHELNETEQTSFFANELFATQIEALHRLEEEAEAELKYYVSQQAVMERVLARIGEVVLEHELAAKAARKAAREAAKAAADALAAEQANISVQ